MRISDSPCMFTNSPEQTISLAKKIAKGLSKGDIVALSGELGSGKTTFAKGIGMGLGVKDSRRINSPTFVLIKEYLGRVPMYHIDLYRLDNPIEVEELGIGEYLCGYGVTVIEWPEKIKSILPKKHIYVKLKVRGKNKREVVIEDFRH